MRASSGGAKGVANASSRSGGKRRDQFDVVAPCAASREASKTAGRRADASRSRPPIVVARGSVRSVRIADALELLRTSAFHSPTTR